MLFEHIRSQELPVGYAPIALRCNGSPNHTHGVPKRDLCKQERLEVGAAKWGRAEVSVRSFSWPSQPWWLSSLPKRKPKENYEPRLFHH